MGWATDEVSEGDEIVAAREDEECECGEECEGDSSAAEEWPGVAARGSLEVGHKWFRSGEVLWVGREGV